jgi:ribosome-associated translation inhibitor RaiA
MRTPLRVTFQNTPPSDALRRTIEEQVDHLEQFFGRLVGCHVVFKLPDGNHRTGGSPYEVNVHIKMPGGQTVDVDRAPGLDERFADPLFAVSDAFRRARRRLQDRSRVMRREVKTHHGRASRGSDDGPPSKH